jgi:sugar/nucleoside kinase (ribokinase family)
MTTAITVVGDALLDVHVVPGRPPRPGGDVPAEIRLEPGGQGANVAVRLGRRRLPVRLVCALGGDAAGGFLRERLAADGVQVVGISAPASGAVVVLLDAMRERTMLSQRVPFAVRLRHELLAEAGWLVVSGYLLLEPDAGISGSGDSPRRVLLGCALDSTQVSGWLDAAADLQPHLAIVNADEAGAISGYDAEPPTLARHVADRLGAVAVVTHPGGAAASLDGVSVEIAATSAEPAVDTTGAGDAFSAGLIADLAYGRWPLDAGRLEHAMTSGADLASAVASVLGAQGRVAAEPPS